MKANRQTNSANGEPSEGKVLNWDCDSRVQ